MMVGVCDCACRTHTVAASILGVLCFFLLCVRGMSATSPPARAPNPTRNGPLVISARSPPSSVVPRRGHAPHVLHQRGGPPCLHPQGAALPRRRLIVLRCSARGAAHAKRDQASAPLYAHICSLRRKRLRTAGRRNPRTLPASRPMTNSPSSASSARSASACCRCSARRWPCELLRHVRRCAACPTGVHCDLPNNTLSSSPCPCIRTVICDVSLLSCGTWKHLGGEKARYELSLSL